MKPIKTQLCSEDQITEHGLGCGGLKFPSVEPSGSKWLKHRSGEEMLLSLLGSRNLQLGREAGKEGERQALGQESREIWQRNVSRKETWV